VQRQRRDAPVGRGEAEVGGDGPGVAREVAVGEADELGRARRARRAEEQGKVRVEVAVLGAAPVDLHVDVAGRDHRGRRPGGHQPVGVVAGEEGDVALVE
jgi:hypothetical protein